MSVGSTRVEVDYTFDLYMVLSEGTEFYRADLDKENHQELYYPLSFHTAEDPERQRQPCTDRSS